MIEEALRAGPLRVKLADVIREVNASHARAGGENPDLDACWLRLDKGLQLAHVSGDERAANVAIDTYRAEALKATEDQARRIARKAGTR